jgi:23S rRNA-/tRNA-specific pseudouridylate synthase
MLLADRVLFIDAEAMVLDKPAGLAVGGAGRRD